MKLVHKMSALIIAKPSRLRDGLQTLLRAIPNLESIRLADDISTASQLISQNQPTLILLGSNLSDEDIQTLLTQTKTGLPDTQSIALVKNIHQQNIARVAGADRVLLTGFPAEKFFTTVDELLTAGSGNGHGRSKC